MFHYNDQLMKMFYIICFIASDVLKRIDNLRTYFGKECGKEALYKPKSGSAQKSPFKSSWPWFSELLWLKDHLAIKDSCLNKSTPKLENGGHNNEEPNTGASTVASLQGQRKRARTTTNDDRLIKAAEDMVSFLPQLAKRDTVSQM